MKASVERKHIVTVEINAFEAGVIVDALTLKRESAVMNGDAARLLRVDAMIAEWSNVYNRIMGDEYEERGYS